MFFALVAKDRPNMLDRRAAIRPVHLQHLKNLGEKLKLAGALLNTDGNPEGSLVVYEADSLEEARTALKADPFIIEDIFETVEIRPWRVAIDNISVRG